MATKQNQTPNKSKKPRKIKLVDGELSHEVTEQGFKRTEIELSGHDNPNSDIIEKIEENDPLADEEIVKRIVEHKPRKRVQRKREELPNPDAPRWTEENAAHVRLGPSISETHRDLFLRCADESGDAREALEQAIDLLQSMEKPWSEDLTKPVQLGTRISREHRNRFNDIAKSSPSKRLALETAIEFLAEHLGIDPDPDVT
ncbi:MAG: hypothetical protein AAFQ24_14000 [Pseudomonadota bacterium]